MRMKWELNVFILTPGNGLRSCERVWSEISEFAAAVILGKLLVRESIGSAEFDRSKTKTVKREEYLNRVGITLVLLSCQCTKLT